MTNFSKKLILVELIPIIGRLCKFPSRLCHYIEARITRKVYLCICYYSTSNCGNLIEIKYRLNMIRLTRYIIYRNVIAPRIQECLILVLCGKYTIVALIKIEIYLNAKQSKFIVVRLMLSMTL